MFGFVGADLSVAEAGQRFEAAWPARVKVAEFAGVLTADQAKSLRSVPTTLYSRGYVVSTDGPGEPLSALLSMLPADKRTNADTVGVFNDIYNSLASSGIYIKRAAASSGNSEAKAVNVANNLTTPKPGVPSSGNLTFGQILELVGETTSGMLSEREKQRAAKIAFDQQKLGRRIYAQPGGGIGGDIPMWLIAAGVVVVGSVVVALLATRGARNR